MKVLAFAASNSRKSINKDPIRYASTLLPVCDLDIIDVKTMKCPSTTATLRWPRAYPEQRPAFSIKSRKQMRW